MKVTETRSHDKDDNYLKEKTESGKEMGRMRQGKERAFCSMKSFTGLTKCKRRSWPVFCLF